MSDPQGPSPGWRASLHEVLRWRNSGLIVVGLLGLIGLRLQHYLLFHTLAELLSVVVAVTVTVVTWYTYRYSRNHLLMYLGCGFFWVGGLDLIHLMVFPGMPEPFGASTDHGARYWIASRYLEALLFLTAPAFLRRSPIAPGRVFAGFGVIFVLVVTSILTDVFPTTYIPGQGLTPFKIGSEYLIVAISSLAWWRLYRIRAELGHRLFHFLAASILLGIVGELCFTLYDDPYGLFNLSGHLLKIASFWLIFLSVVLFPLQQLLDSAEQTQRSERRFHQMFDHSPDAILVVDEASGRVVAANARVAEQFDAPIERVVGRHFSNFHPPEGREQALQQLDRIRRGEVERLEMDLIRDDRERIPIEITARPLELEDGRPAVIAFLRDISARRARTEELQASAELLRSTIESLDDLLFLLDADGRFLEFPQHDNGRLLMPPAAFVGRHYRDVLPPHLVALIDAAFPAARDTSATQSFEYPLELNEATSWFNARMNARRDAAGRFVGTTTAVRDVTERKRMEQALIETRDAADAANRAKSAFLANMSHELRTPLNSVLGFAQLLDREPRLDDTQHRWVRSILHSGEHLLTLISDILDLTKIEAGRFETFPGDWESAEFFADIIGMFDDRALEKGITLSHRTSGAIPPLLHCDERRLRQVLMNLLGNAIKFTEQGVVTLYSDYRDQTLCLTVEDTGVGIAADSLEAIFQPFHQAGDAHYRQQGTGLGLGITRRLLDAMGGRIRVESAVGRGSRFSVEIPAPPATAPPSSTPIVAGHGRIIGHRRLDGDGPLRVLVADDIAENRHVLRCLLERLGFAVWEADDGRTCVDAAQVMDPDLILIDLRMPGMDGAEATRILRSNPPPHSPVIIAVTAAVFPEDHARALAAGCDGHIAKPVAFDRLLEVLEGHLPIAWQVEAPAAEPPPAPVTAPPLARRRLARLSAMARRGDLKGLEVELQGWQREQPNHHTLRQLLDLAGRFDIKGLRGQLERLERNE